jgi:outer membrane biosynthesis protein TonB
VSVRGPLTVVLVLTSLVAVALHAAAAPRMDGICRSVDRRGNVQYGDCPPSTTNKPPELEPPAAVEPPPITQQPTPPAAQRPVPPPTQQPASPAPQQSASAAMQQPEPPATQPAPALATQQPPSPAAQRPEQTATQQRATPFSGAQPAQVAKTVERTLAAMPWTKATATSRKTYPIVGLPLFVGGVLVSLAASIAFLVAAFRVGVWWGLGCIFVAPVSLVFLVMHWRIARRSFLASLAGWVVGVVGYVLLGGS